MSDQPEAQRNSEPVVDEEYLLIRRATVVRGVGALLSTALMLLFAAFYGMIAYRHHVDMPSVCLSGGNVVIVLAMAVVMLAKQKLPSAALAAPAALAALAATTATTAETNLNAGTGQDDSPVKAELLKALRTLNDVQSRHGTFGPTIACTIIKEGVPQEGYFVSYAPPIVTDEFDNTAHFNVPTGSEKLAVQGAPPVTLFQNPPTGPHQAYLDDGTEEAFYDAQDHQPTTSPTECAQEPLAAVQPPKPEAGQQAMGQTKRKPPPQLVLPTESPNVQGTAGQTSEQAPPPEEANNVAVEQDRAASPESDCSSLDEPDAVQHRRRLHGGGLMPRLDIPHGHYSRCHHPHCHSPTFGFPVPYAFEFVELSEPELAHEAIDEDPDMPPPYESNPMLFPMELNDNYERFDEDEPFDDNHQSDEGELDNVSK